MNRAKADNASKWLNSQIEELQLLLSDSEKALRDFMNENQLINIQSQIELATAEVATLVNEKLAVDRAFARVENSYLKVQESEGDPKALLGVDWMLQSDLVFDIRTRVVAQQQTMDEISKRYKYKHHRYIAAKAKLDRLINEQTEILTKLTASLDQEYKAATERVVSVNRRIEEARAKHRDLGRHELQLAKLRREVDATQKMYDAFLSRLQETEILKDLSSSEQFAVLDIASVPNSPSEPRVALLMIMTFIVALILSIAFWLLLHMISDKETIYRQMMRKLEIPILAEIPKLKRSKESKNVRAVINEGMKNYQYSEAIRSLRTSVLVNRQGLDRRIIAVTSIGLDAGKSSVAISLAKSLSKIEKTLLADLDLRAPSICRAFGLKNDHPGLTDFIERKVSFSKTLHKETVTGLNVLPSGEVPIDPMMYISKSRFADIVKKLGVFYDRVILETPELVAFSDTLVLSRCVDGIIIVLEPDATEARDIQQAIQRLQEIGAPLMGVVFNKVRHTQYTEPHSSLSRKIISKLTFGKLGTA